MKAPIILILALTTLSLYVQSDPEHPVPLQSNALEAMPDGEGGTTYCAFAAGPGDGMIPGSGALRIDMKDGSDRLVDLAKVLRLSVTRSK